MCEGKSKVSTGRKRSAAKMSPPVFPVDVDKWRPVLPVTAAACHFRGWCGEAALSSLHRFSVMRHILTTSFFFFFPPFHASMT